MNTLGGFKEHLDYTKLSVPDYAFELAYEFTHKV